MNIFIELESIIEDRPDDDMIQISVSNIKRMLGSVAAMESKAANVRAHYRQLFGAPDEEKLKALVQAEIATKELINE